MKQYERISTKKKRWHVPLHQEFFITYTVKDIREQYIDI